MPIDRDAALKEAEHLLRQGKLDGAIEAYVRLVEDRPSDWNSINTLGDLCLRAGDVERAIAQFTSAADQFSADGALQKAAALYKKARKAQGDGEPALRELGETAARQGLPAEAEVYRHRLADRRRYRGDEPHDADRLSLAEGVLPEVEALPEIEVPLEVAALPEIEAPLEIEALPAVAAPLEREVPLEAGAPLELEVPLDLEALLFEAEAALGIEIPPEIAALPEVEAPRGIEVPPEVEAPPEAPVELEVPLEVEALFEVEAFPEIDVPLDVDLSDAVTDSGAAPAAPAAAPPAHPHEPEPEHVQVGGGGEDVAELESAARDPRTRFAASAACGRLHVRRGDLRAGIEWLERAVEVPPAGEEERFAALHDLADALERHGEMARALAVLIELDLDSGGYRDGRARIDRLVRAQSESPGQ